MKSYLRFTLIFLFTLGIFLFQLPSAFAGWDHNIRGEAYTQQEDYIYFNCLDQPSGSFTYTFPFPLGGDPCVIEYEGVGGVMVDDYGVNLDYNTFVFTGHARHEKHGLISFENGPPTNYNFLDDCSEEGQLSQADCEAVNCSACYNIDSQRIHGWAFVVSGNNWIKLDNTNITEEIDRMGLYNYTKGDEAGDFFGYFHHNTWGPIDLNECYSNLNCSPNNPEHKVYVGKLELARMSAPNWGSSKACSLSSTALGALLKWDVHGGNIGGYDIAISEINNLNHSSTEIFEFTNDFKMGNHFQHEAGEGIFDYNLNYNTSYYWWIKLHDNVYSTSTEWIQFDHSDDPIDDVQGELTDNEAENTQNNTTDPHLTFTTYKHEWPRPYFTWEGHPETDFLAGASNRFEVSTSTKYYTDSTTSVSFGDFGFEENFSWWGEIDGTLSDKITIVDAAIFPDSPIPDFRLDASSISELGHNDPIQTWEDISGGTSYNVTQSTQSERPKYHLNALNGRPGTI